jgi:ribulose-phosphate 3-epimerase
MIENPDHYLEQFVRSGANSISVHAEVCKDLPAIAHRMHQLGIRAAIAINPETEPPALSALLPFWIRFW